MDSPIKQGDSIVYVRNTQLAAALYTIGIPLRKDPPYTKSKRVDDSLMTTWHFHPKDSEGLYDTVELMEAWKDDVEFIRNNPTHPFTYTMLSIKNYKQFVDHVHRQKPWVSYKFKNGKKTMWVIEGSEKEQGCIEKGMTRC